MQPSIDFLSRLTTSDSKALLKVVGSSTSDSQTLARTLGLTSLKTDPDDEAFVKIIIIIGVILILANIVVIALDTSSDGDEGNINAQYNNYIDDVNPVLSIWALKDKENVMPIVVDMHIEEQTNAIIETIREESPEYLINTCTQSFKG